MLTSFTLYFTTLLLLYFYFTDIRVENIRDILLLIIPLFLILVEFLECLHSRIHATLLVYIKSNIINKSNINNNISCIGFIKCTIWKNKSFFHDINTFRCFSYLLTWSRTNVQMFGSKFNDIINYLRYF